MALVHGTMFLTCLFVPNIVSRLTSKWTIITGLLFYICWIAANFYPRVYTLIPASIGVGFGQSLTWGAQVVYIHQLSDLHSDITSDITQQELIKSNGVFMAVFQTSHIWGNLLSSFWLTSPSSSSSSADESRDGGGDITWIRDVSNDTMMEDGYSAEGAPVHKCGTYDTVHEEGKWWLLAFSVM